MSQWESLLDLMNRLRDPGGCPWDQQQTMADLKGYLLEEAYEVVDAIDAGDMEGLREELGDLLFQVVFLSRIAQEEGRFSVDEVLGGIVEKMVRRHPHVFGDARAETSADVLRQWEAIKKSEKNHDAAESLLDGLPRSLPALLRAQRLTTKAARVGFDWPGPREVLGKVSEELGEIGEALASGEAGRVEEEIGDLLFAVANLARHMGLDPETALQRANGKFVRRFQRVEELLRDAGRPVGQATLSEMDSFWEQAKREERGDPPAC